MKRRFRKRVAAFSFGVSVFVSFLFAAGGIAAFFVPSYQSLGETNRGTFERIRCSKDSCDIQELVNDANFTGADYVLTRDDHFFVDAKHHSGFWLEFSDRTFLQKFEKPADLRTRGGETWRLFSRSVTIGGKNVRVMTGVVTEASYLMKPSPPNEETDADLIEEADKIIARLKFNGAAVVSLGIRTKADGYQVTDAATQMAIDWGGGIPAYFPPDRELRNSLLFVDQNGGLNLVRTDYDRDLIAVSLQNVGNSWVLAGSLIAVFWIIFSSFYVLGVTLLKRHLMMFGKKF